MTDAVLAIGDLVGINVKDDRLQRICLHVITDPLFKDSPGSSLGKSGHSHHAYRGGLAIHTLEVLQNALAMAESAAIVVDREVLTVAVVAHDYMKIREYVLGEDGSIECTNYRNLVRHVAGSHAEFVSMCNSYGYDEVERMMLIEHAILAHHGRLEWQSPTEPQTTEAMILHFADMLSSTWGTGKVGVNDL